AQVVSVIGEVGLLAVGRAMSNLEGVDQMTTRDAPRTNEEETMQVERPITSEITISDQPTEDDLSPLKSEGYAGVVNLRNAGEPEQPMSPSEEGQKAKALGMDYLHYGVGGSPLTQQGVTAVCDFVDRHAQVGQKVLVHCRKGPRAVALVLL